MSECDCAVEIESKSQARILVILLIINATMFVAEMVAGFIAESTGLIADSLDMLADAMVYGIGLYAVGKAANAKINAALLSGFFQIVLALGVITEITRRAIMGSEPEPVFMIIVSMVALIANVACLILISKHRDGEVHMRASWIFSKNDVIANVGVILGGVLVYTLDSRLPDLVIGTIIVLIVLRGGYAIISDASQERNKLKGSV
jgi:cation diffusion facilitator family transporter